MQGAGQAQPAGFPGTQVPTGTAPGAQFPGAMMQNPQAPAPENQPAETQAPYPPQAQATPGYPGAMPGYGQMPGAVGTFPQQPAYYPGYQQGYPMQGFQQHQGFPQPGFPQTGFPQPGFPQAGAPGQGYTQVVPAPAQQGPYVSERGAAALLFIYQNGKGGPTDLTRALGRSDAHVTRARCVGEARASCISPVRSMCSPTWVRPGSSRARGRSSAQCTPQDSTASNRDTRRNRETWITKRASSWTTS